MDGQVGTCRKLSGSIHHVFPFGVTKERTFGQDSTKIWIPSEIPQH